MNFTIRLTLFFLGYTLTCFSQAPTQIKVTYKLAAYEKLQLNKDEKYQQLTTDFKQIFEKLPGTVDQVVFELVCNQHEAVYTQQKIMVKEEDEMSYNLMSIMGGGERIFYTNTTDSVRYYVNPGYNKTTGIAMPFDKYHWQITPEAKEINGMMCYKALGSFEQYHHKLGELTTYEVEAWFCPAIPFPFGPKCYGGLPGLIVQLDTGSKIYTYVADIDLKYTGEIIKPEIRDTIAELDYLKSISKNIKF